MGNPAYAVHLAQGAMGGRCIKLVAHAKQLDLQHANDAAYHTMGLESAGQAELTTTGKWGLHFVGRGEQVLCVIPSLGSQLAGPASGGGGDCVVVTMGVVNCLRGLMGLPPIDPTESPLLACTTGKGRSGAQLRRIAEQMRVRGAGEWRHPSQDGGAIGGAGSGWGATKGKDSVGSDETRRLAAEDGVHHSATLPLPRPTLPSHEHRPRARLALLALCSGLGFLPPFPPWLLSLA